MTATILRMPVRDALKDVSEEDKAALESLVDRYNLDTVLWGLAGVCADKAEHVRSTWGDERLASRWEDRAETLMNLELPALYR